MRWNIRLQKRISSYSNRVVKQQSVLQQSFHTTFASGASRHDDDPQLIPFSAIWKNKEFPRNFEQTLQNSGKNKENSREISRISEKFPVFLEVCLNSMGAMSKLRDRVCGVRGANRRENISAFRTSGKLISIIFYLEALKVRSA